MKMTLASKNVIPLTVIPLAVIPPAVWSCYSLKSLFLPDIFTAFVIPL
jgi:hypothetical protein